MDPFQQQPPPVGELASTLAATNQAVNATTGINIATSDPAASTRVTPAPAVDGTSAEGAIGVNSSDSPLSDSSEERVRYSQWDDLGMSYTGSANLKHRAIPTFSFQGAISRPRTTSSSSSARAPTPCLSTAALQDGSYQPGRAYHTTHEDRYDMAGARAAWGIEGLWGSHQDRARETLLQELFPDVGQNYVDWDFTSGNSFEAFMLKRQEMERDERPSLWRTNGSWEVTSDRETPSMGMIHMAHYGSLPPSGNS